MNEYTASNGAEVKRHEDGRLIVESAYDYDYLHPDNELALREFFQHERDVELGRWRWPENKAVVVYPQSEGTHWVVREDTGEARKRNGIYVDDPYGMAASDYREAHPERKAWHDAKPGEVWVVKEHGQPERAYMVDDTQFYDSSRDCALNFDDSVITDARRIWPTEDAS